MASKPRILVGVGGGIAAYKALDVVSALRKKGAEVTVLLSRNAHHFVAPLSLQVISGRPVGQDLYHEPPEWGVGHVRLAHEADAFVVVAATADLMAKLAVGMADDFVTACALVYHPKPLLLAPAMNTAMWEHPAVEANLKTLKSRGAQVVAPVAGVLADGDVGVGKLAEPGKIAEAAWGLALRGRLKGAGTSGQALVRAKGWASKEAASETLVGKRVLVSAGPTREYLDPVRFISNPSSGKMGFALAAACRGLGAEVTLVTGPVSLASPEGVQVVRVTTAVQMMDACEKAFEKADAFISAAAVSDFRPAQALLQKKKKDGAGETLRLVPNPDVLLALSKRKGQKVLVGFAAETEKLMQHAEAKYKKKRLDLLVANEVGKAGQGFESDDNAATLLWPGKPAERVPLQSKVALAQRIALELAKLLGRG